MFVSHYVEKLRCAICVAHLVLDECLSYYDTNSRHMFSERVSDYRTS
jgi:hypothetical protein